MVALICSYHCFKKKQLSEGRAPIVLEDSVHSAFVLSLTVKVERKMFLCENLESLGFILREMKGFLKNPESRHSYFFMFLFFTFFFAPPIESAIKVLSMC